MKPDKYLEEYLIEVTVNDTNLQGILNSLVKIDIKLDKSFIPKLLKIKSKSSYSKNFLIKGMLSQKAFDLLKLNHNVVNFWACSGTIPF